MVPSYFNVYYLYCFEFRFGNRMWNFKSEEKKCNVSNLHSENKCSEKVNINIYFFNRDSIRKEKIPFISGYFLFSFILQSGKRIRPYAAKKYKIDD